MERWSRIRDGSDNDKEMVMFDVFICLRAGCDCKKKNLINQKKKIRVWGSGPAVSESTLDREA